MVADGPSTLLGALRKRTVLVSLVLLSSVGCDRVTKEVAEDSLRGLGRISMLRDTARLEYVENRGAFLGVGAKLPEPARTILLTGGVAVMVAVLLGVALLARGNTRLQTAAWALIASGGLGNLWDRIGRDGAVVDFLNLGIGTLRTGVFNVADLAIVVGVGVLALTRRTAEHARDSG
jgi:signal peptidase II